MDTEVTLTVREQKRLFVITEVLAGRWTAPQAAGKLELSLRHMRRLLAAFRRDGPAGLVHRNRGRPSERHLAAEIREEVAALAATHYPDYNDHHLADVLAEDHGICISRSSVRRIRREAGLLSPRKRRPPRHRRCRERSPRPGMLLQLDGSHHHWLEDRGPELCLIAAIDDATGEVPWALFRPQEDAAGYFLLLRQISQSHGLPLALYADRHTIFQSPKKASLSEELAGQPPRTQFGRLLNELSVQLIPAYSPQAKGRIERLFGTLQDRLVKALRQAGACSLEEANLVLQRFLPRFNSRFVVTPTQPGTSYRPWPTNLQPDDVFCFKQERVVAKDNTISFDGQRLPIFPSRRSSYARCRVEVRQLLNGQLLICYQGSPLMRFQPLDPGPPAVGKFTPANPQPTSVKLPTPRSGLRPKASRRPYKPPPDHPWRQYAFIHARLAKDGG